MNEEQRMAEVEKFKNYFSYISRPGADKLLAWLEEAGFFTAPASTKYGTDGKKGGIVMGYMDHTLKKTVPYYSTMKRAGAFKQQEPRKRQKRTTLTEYSQNGQKAVLKPHVTVNQAAKKLYDYEQTRLSPHEVANLVEQVQNLTRRVKKYESWEE